MSGGGSGDREMAVGCGWQPRLPLAKVVVAHPKGGDEGGGAIALPWQRSWGQGVGAGLATGAAIDFQFDKISNML